MSQHPELRSTPRGAGDVPTHQELDAVEVKNRVQVGPILAGVLTAIATMLILTVLGLAIGTTALEPLDAGERMGTAAAIWGLISAIIAFFLGGWVAAKTAAVAGGGSGLINGLMVGAAVLTFVLWLTGSGVSALLGTLGTNIGDIANLAQDQGVATQDVQQQAQDAQEQVVEEIDTNQAFDTVREGAWWTLLGLIIPLAASGLGGLVGKNERDEVIQVR